MNRSKTIVGLGEALYDLFPEGARLGGAPLNVAVHAHQLGSTGVVVSRVGQDALGDGLLAELRRRGMPIDHVQTDPDRPTGTVSVDLVNGEPLYDITAEVAWDYLQWDGDLDALANQCDAVCFGTLALRCAQSRSTIYRLVELARRAARLLDVNLRGDVDRAVLIRALKIASAVKMNGQELARLRHLLLLPDGDAEAAAELRSEYELKWVAVTRGAQGVTVYDDAGEHTAQGVAASEGGDPVGAGDSVSAALLHGTTRRWVWHRTLTLANALGAHVASQQGACPELTDALYELAGVTKQAGE